VITVKSANGLETKTETTLSVLPDGATFLTAGLTIDLHAPMRAGEVTIGAEVIRLTGRDATVEVTIGQRDRIVSLATARQVIRP